MAALSEDERVPAGEASPESGPRILFFTGGSALRPTCRLLKRTTHNSIHLVTPFDSGGSSGPLREAFGMPAIGDLRNRLLALADEDLPGAAEAASLVAHRFDARASASDLSRRLEALISGDDALVSGAPPRLADYARAKLETFCAQVPEGFDLRGASVGNLILTGAWLELRKLAPILRSFSELLTVRGTVLPTVDADLHLAVRLEDGSQVVGQHRFTGKEHPVLTSPVRELLLVNDLEHGAPTRVDASTEALDAIRNADLICFPMGSFFSSVLCNVLPKGIGRAVSEARCPKIYVPSAGDDPEMRGIDAAGGTALLLEALRRDAGEDAPTDRLLDAVLLWRSGARCMIRPSSFELERLPPPDHVEIEPEELVEVLSSLAS